MNPENIMEQAQVFASAWSLIGGRFDFGSAIDDAKEAKRELGEMVNKLAAERDDLLGALKECDESIAKAIWYLQKEST